MSTIREQIQDGQHAANLVIRTAKLELDRISDQHIAKETFWDELKVQFDNLKKK